MAWISLTLDIPAQWVEPISDWLSAAGALAVTARDAGDQPIFEPDPDQQPLWPQVRVEALLPDDADAAEIARALGDWCRRQGVIALAPELVALPEQDWSSTWRAGLEPRCFNRRLWVIARDVPAPADDAAVLRLDPGLAFGTGNHATTALCLAWLAEADLAGKSVVDYGCGSGILGIAALLLGAAHTVCVDHDPQALIATTDNATFNGIAPSRLTVCAPAALPRVRAGYDVVLANILANPLITLAPRLTSLLRPGGWLVLSGVLEPQWRDVEAAYPAVRFAPPAVRDGWVAAAGRYEDAH
jgi:ribosomal protein L11 methyltransferase